MTREYITVNEKGMRVGQSHPNAVLSDVEVEALILDRGPDDAPTMSYRELAEKWGVSKSSVRDMLIGRRRGQTKKEVDGVETSKRAKQKKIRVDLRVTLRARALLHKLGGGKWIDHMAWLVNAELARAPTLDVHQALARALRRIGGVK